MRRTSIMVLGLALFMLAALTAPSDLLAVARTKKPAHPVSSTLPSHRRAGKSAPRSAHHPAPHATPREAGRARSRVNTRATARTSRAAAAPRPRTAGGRAHAAQASASLHRLRSYRVHRSRHFRPSPSTAQADTIAGAAASAGGQAVARTVSFYRRGAMPAPLRGSLDSLERQNTKAEAEGLERIEDEADLADRIARKALVPIPVSAALSVNTDLPEAHRYCRQWTARFLSDLAQAHAAQFHQPLYVSSAVRTVEYQKRLMHINGNAAAAEGDIVSPHLTGATVDIAKSSLGRQQIGWMRSWLLPLQLAGKIDVEEEFHQSCFHITVYNNYVPARSLSPTMRAKTRQASPDEATPDQPGQTDAAPKKPVGAKAHPAESVAAVTPTLGR